MAHILGCRLFSLTYSNICLMARHEDLVLYKVMRTRDIVKCFGDGKLSCINPQGNYSYIDLS